VRNKNKSSISDVVITALSLEKDTKSGRRNIMACIAPVGLAFAVVPVKAAEIIGSTVAILFGKPQLHFIPEWTVVLLLILACLLPVICMAFLTFASKKFTE